MGLFDFFKKKKIIPVENSVEVETGTKVTTVCETEKKNYQPDEYYKTKTHEGTPFEHTVVTFEMRKDTCIPSENGLYVAEILLLEYCTYGKYPGPKNGYPGFWWFEYGIRDVGAILKSLEDRGFIRYVLTKKSIESLKITELKDLLQSFNASTAGKKSDLVTRVQEIVPEEVLLKKGCERKYELTELGQKELENNLYVPYMHKHPHKTSEDDRVKIQFNVWRINRLLGDRDKVDWKSIVDRIENEIEQEKELRNAQFMQSLKEINRMGYDSLAAQDEQLAIIQKAEDKYAEDKDIIALIRFWEYLWDNGGLLFEGAHWHFRLADLYIKVKRYDDAISYCNRIMTYKPNYAYKAFDYIRKIKEKKNKISAKK